MMARYRRDLDWEGQLATAIDPERARALWEGSHHLKGQHVQCVESFVPSKFLVGRTGIERAMKE